MPKKHKSPASIDEIKRLYVRAQGHDLYIKDGDTRHIEAFLLQAIILESVLTRLGLKHLEVNRQFDALKKRRRKRYSFEDSVNDLYLLDSISTKDYVSLHDFKKRRNYYVHRLLSKRVDEIEKEARNDYKKYADLVWQMLSKLERRL